MQKQINIGIEDYKKIIDTNGYYVDKTLLIKTLLDHRHEVHLIMRPRRFGKTLAMSTIQTFFEDARDLEGNKIDNSYYFKDKKIYSEGENYLQHIGKYPVITISLKAAKQPTFELSYRKICEQIANEFRRHQYALNLDILDKEEKDVYLSIMHKKAGYSDYCTALELLSHYLERYHNQKVLVLIDEYDVPLQISYYNGFYTLMVDFILSLFESVLKTNSSLLFGVVTGCLRISKESIFTGLNHPNESSVLDPLFADYFGFTTNEVEELLDYHSLSDYLPDVKDWYNGYLFGETEIYNPWSVLKCAQAILSGRNDIFKDYWANTSSNDILRDLIINSKNNTIREKFEALIQGGKLRVRVAEDLTYDMLKGSNDSIWSFLLFTGYLKKQEDVFENDEWFVDVVIPNKEVRNIYKRFFMEWFEDNVRQLDLTPFVKAMETGDCGTMTDFLCEQLENAISYFDSAESFYHGFLLGLLGTLQNYKAKSNREAGDGRPDIVLKGKRSKGIIFEFKIASKFKEMDSKCNEALKQIEDKHYDYDLEEDGYTDIKKYGICFYKKRCLVKTVVVPTITLPLPEITSASAFD